MELVKELKAGHESLMLALFIEKMDAKYDKIESYKRLEILNALTFRIAKFIEKYGCSPILNVEPETRTIECGFSGERKKGSLRIQIHSKLFEEIPEMPIPTISTLTAPQILDTETKAHEELLSPKEASRMLGINYRTLWTWAKKKGKIRYVQLPSGRLRYPKEVIESILKKRN